jgi:hypothetical protein
MSTVELLASGGIKETVVALTDAYVGRTSNAQVLLAADDVPVPESGRPADA